jgi:hypothetical protein
MRLILGWCCVAVVAIGLTTNAAFMLVSPRAWFRLPRWIKLTGSLSERRHGTGWGAMEVRLVGAITLGVVGCVLYHLLVRNH